MADICQTVKWRGKYPPLSRTLRLIIIIVLVYTMQVEKIEPKTTLSVTIN